MYRALDMSCKVAVYGSRRAAEGSRGAVESSRELQWDLEERQTVSKCHVSRLGQSNTIIFDIRQRIPNTNEYRIPTNSWTNSERIPNTNEYRIPTNSERIPNTNYSVVFGIRWYSFNYSLVFGIRCYSVFVELFIQLFVRYSVFGIRWYSVFGRRIANSPIF